MNENEKGVPHPVVAAKKRRGGFNRERKKTIEIRTSKVKEEERQIRNPSSREKKEFVETIPEEGNEGTLISLKKKGVGKYLYLNGKLGWVGNRRYQR